MEVIARYDPDLFEVFDAVINTNNYGKLTPQRVRDLFASVLASRVHDGYISFRTARGILDNVSQKAMGGFGTRGFRAVGGAMTAYLQALKKWNDKPDRWCSPRKNTPAHAEVISLMTENKPAIADLTDADFEGVEITDEEIASYIQEKYPALELTLAEIEQYIDEFDPKVFGDIRESDLAKVVIDDEEIARYLADVEANVKNARELLLGLSAEDLEGVEITDAEIAEYVDELDKIDAKIAEAKAPATPKAKAPRAKATPKPKAEAKPRAPRRKKETPEEELAREKAEMRARWALMPLPVVVKPKAPAEVPHPVSTGIKPKPPITQPMIFEDFPKITPATPDRFPVVPFDQLYKPREYSADTLDHVVPRENIPKASSGIAYVMAQDLSDRADAMPEELKNAGITKKAKTYMEWLDDIDIARIFQPWAPTWKKFKLEEKVSRIKNALAELELSSNLKSTADTPEPEFFPNTMIPDINSRNYRARSYPDWVPVQDRLDFERASTGLEWLQKTHQKLPPAKEMEALDYYEAVFKSLLGEYTRGLNIPLWIQRVKYVRNEKTADWNEEGLDYPQRTELPQFAKDQILKRLSALAVDFNRFMNRTDEYSIPKAREKIYDMFRRIWRIRSIMRTPYVDELYDEIAKAQKYYRPTHIEEFRHLGQMRFKSRGRDGKIRLDASMTDPLKVKSDPETLRIYDA